MYYTDLPKSSHGAINNFDYGDQYTEKVKIQHNMNADFQLNNSAK